MSLRLQAKKLYKTLLCLGKDYPTGYIEFRNKVHDAFYKNKDVQDEKTIKKLIIQGKYMTKEIEAMYKLKKYRTLKKRYYID